jgi:hypothetical protein
MVQYKEKKNILCLHSVIKYFLFSPKIITLLLNQILGTKYDAPYPNISIIQTPRGLRCCPRIYEGHYASLFQNRH